MACGRSPCSCQDVQTRNVRTDTYIDDGILALYGDLEMCPGELHVQVAALVFAVDGNCHIQVLDRLRPLVG